MQNPMSTPVVYTFESTAARQRRLAAQAARNQRRMVAMQAWRHANPHATSAELLAAVEAWERQEQEGGNG